MKHFALSLILLVLFSISPGSISHRVMSRTAAKETWTRVKSKHFLLVGDAGEREIRKAAVKLEQFREVFSRLFPKVNLNSPIPITVIVFKNRQSYLPFMPIYQGKVSEVAGYFQSGPEINYITLISESSRENSFSTIFHEYVHSLTNDNTFQMPTWFSEGLAEFYSTFEVTDGDKKVWLGKPISNHVYLLRENKLLPLPKLFAVDHGSPDYNEQDKKGVFYSQSWALVHFLMLGNNSQRHPQLINYLGLLSQGKSTDESFRQAFQTDYATMEKDLNDYISRHSYPVQTFSFEQKLEFDSSLQSAQISEAEWNYYLGDLVLHLNRTDCEEYLQKAIKMDPHLAVAYASLGMAQMKMQRMAEAKQSLQRALSIGSPNHMVHYYYAFILSREGLDANNRISGYDPALAQLMRENLKKAITLAPDFPEPYHLLAFVNLVTDEELTETVSLLKHAIVLSPSRQEFTLMLSQVYLRQQKYDEAQKLLEPIVRNAQEPGLRERAQSRLDSIKSLSEQLTRTKAESNAGDGSAGAEAASRLPQRRFDGETVRGLLTEIACSDGGMTIIVKDGARTVKLHTASVERVYFITYTRDTKGMINCGKVNPAKSVLVTYRASTEASSPFDGEPIAVEFMKAEQK